MVRPALVFLGGPGLAAAFAFEHVKRPRRPGVPHAVGEAGLFSTFQAARRDRRGAIFSVHGRLKVPGKDLMAS
jgi:hypothetical protein